MLIKRPMIRTLEEAKKISRDRRYLKLAQFVSEWSKDPSTKTGAAITRKDGTLVSIGYNGFPRGIKDSQRLLNDREEKYKRTIHCEMNAILSAKEDLTGYTLYNWPGQSCDRCAVHVIQAGISRVVYPNNHNDFTERWKEKIELANSLFKEAGVETTCIDME